MVGALGGDGQAVQAGATGRRAKSQMSIISWTSPAPSEAILPTSSVTSRPSAALLARSSSPNRRTSSPRLGAGTSRQTRKASRARVDRAARLQPRRSRAHGRSRRPKSACAPTSVPPLNRERSTPSAASKSRASAARSIGGWVAATICSFSRRPGQGRPRAASALASQDLAWDSGSGHDGAQIAPPLV